MKVFARPSLMCMVLLCGSDGHLSHQGVQEAQVILVSVRTSGRPSRTSRVHPPRPRLLKKMQSIRPWYPIHNWLDSHPTKHEKRGDVWLERVACNFLNNGNDLHRPGSVPGGV